MDTPKQSNPSLLDLTIQSSNLAGQLQALTELKEWMTREGMWPVYANQERSRISDRIDETIMRLKDRMGVE